MGSLGTWQRRRWSLALITVAIVLALSGIAAATYYTGDVSGGGGIDLNGTVFKHHEPTKIPKGGFSWFNVPVASSTGGAGCASSDKLKIAMKVNDKGKFHGSAPIGTAYDDYTATVVGSFVNNNKKAVGTLRLTGTSYCATDTGKLNWVAKRG